MKNKQGVSGGTSGNFVNLFHVVKSNIFEPGEYSVSEFHHGAMLSPDAVDLRVLRQPLSLKTSKRQLQSKSGYLPAILFFLYIGLTIIFCVDGSIKTVEHGKGTSNVQDCSIFIENAPSAPAGDGFGAVRLAGFGLIHEVFQAKHTATPIAEMQFIEEWRKAATQDQDIFILFTTGTTEHSWKLPVRLPHRCGIVRSDQFTAYFGIFAGRAFASAKVNINHASRKQLLQLPFIRESQVRMWPIHLQPHNQLYFLTLPLLSLPLIILTVQ